MRFITNTARQTRAGARRAKLAAASFIFAAMFIAFQASAAQAHHGFDDFDTDRLYYISGTVSQVRWGEPHSYFNATLDSELPADTPELALPEQLQGAEDSGPISDAPSYIGSHDVLEVVIAPPSFTGRWGLDRPLVDGERIEAVGYIGASHDDEFRPVVFWFEDGQPVNQVLGNELPASPLPVPYPADDASAADGDQDAPAAAEDSGGTSPIVGWVTAGVVLVVVVAGGALYLRARSRRE